VSGNLCNAIGILNTVFPVSMHRKELLFINVTRRLIKTSFTKKEEAENPNQSRRKNKY